ncbi:MAG: hypothetical protein B5766_02770 [Candidatus Lumbricidophila eiseniae]|uniref:CopC domain-containing protein n=1 Tax=Candidatus Lumbricidiphila eiseniae TaxID=1969409 RepID=A0A2A6FTU4_9MICO|nr:MAG: hypothetical protein B5766_02770 [Candidatus Lumbricidophila eiseniae]
MNTQSPQSPVVPLGPRITTRRARARAALSVVLGAVLVFAPATGASAHAQLQESSPAPGSVSTEPLSRVSLSFNEPVLILSEDVSAIVEVIGPDQHHYETGCPTARDQVVSVPVTLGATGTYTVNWQVVSDDGHPVSGTYTFSYHPTATATTATGTLSRPSCSAAASNAPALAPASTPATDATPLLTGFALVIGVLLAVGAVAWIMAARHRRREAGSAGVSESVPRNGGE